MLAGCSQIFGLSDPSRARDAGAAIDADDASTSDAAADAPDAFVPPASLLEILEDASLTTNLLVVLDAGDASSYTSGQTWNNLGPAPTEFFLGSNDQIGPDDPTFHGVAGARTPEEYFTFDGGDVFRESAGGWGDDNFHHDNTAFTFVVVTYLVGGFTMFSDCECSDGGENTPGSVFFRNGTGTLAYAQEGVTNQALLTTTTGTLPNNAWAFASVTVVANGETDVVHRFNTTVETYNNENHFYGANAANGPATIGAMSNGVGPAANGTRIALYAVWNRALSQAEMMTLYDAIKAERFPSLP